MTEPVGLTTSSGQRVEVVWGVNGWTRLELEGGRSVEDRARNARDLARMLETIGLPHAEATRLAKAGWSTRPADAGLTTARVSESLFRGTGLAAWQYLVVVGGCVALFAYAFYRVGRDFRIFGG